MKKLLLETNINKYYYDERNDCYITNTNYRIYDWHDLTRILLINNEQVYKIHENMFCLFHDVLMDWAQYDTPDHEVEDLKKLIEQCKKAKILKD